MSDLGGELLISLGLIIFMVVVHLTGLMGLIQLARLHIEHLRTPWLALDRLLVPLSMATGLFTLHGLEVWIYAVAYRASGAEPTWEQALFVSASAYSTLGWTGAHLPDGWRITAALEALSGMLLIGWSTAFLFQTLHRILQTEDSHPLPQGAIAGDAGQDEGAASGSASPRPSGSGSGDPAGVN